MSGLSSKVNWGRFGIAALPWFWLGLFFVLPFLFVLKISLAEPQLAQPPYMDLIREFEDGIMTLVINFGNYQLLLEDSLYINAIAMGWATTELDVQNAHQVEERSMTLAYQLQLHTNQYYGCVIIAIGLGELRRILIYL